MPPSTPPPAAENCAVGTDGKLLDAKDIKWFHSPSDENTIGQIEVDAVGDENENNGNLDAPSTGRGHRAKKPTGKAVMMLELDSEVEFSKKSKANKQQVPKANLKRGKSSASKSSVQCHKPSTSRSSDSTVNTLSSKRLRDVLDDAGEPAAKLKQQRSSNSLAQETNIDLTGDYDNDDGSEWSPEGTDIGNRERSVQGSAKLVQLATDEENSSNDSDSDVSATEQYNRMKKRMSLDDDSFAKARRSDQTADVRLVFTKGTQKLPNGNEIDGNWCLICKGLGEMKAFFKGNITTLRTHIQRCSKTHWTIYESCCKENNIQPNERCRPIEKSPKDAQNLKQTTLDPELLTKPAPWSKEGLKERLIAFVVQEDHAFQMVDRSPLRDLLIYQRPQNKDSDIPHRTLLRESIIKKAQETIHNMAKSYELVPGKISYMFDAWTSQNYDPYLAVTAHYIKVDPDVPTKWTLETNLLAFTNISGNHSGRNTAALIGYAVNRYKIRDKLGWGTSDNASANDTTMHHLEKTVFTAKDGKSAYPRKSSRIRCGAHTVHLSAKHFIETICPTPAKYRTQQGTVSAEDEGYDDDFNGDGSEEIVEGEEADVEWEAGDVLGKALALITQIRLSPQARAYFLWCCQQVKITPLQLLRWIRTRWSSMYDLLKRFLTLKKAIIYFINNADDSEKVPKLTKKRSYSEFRITADEWTTLKLIHEILEAQAKFSAEQVPTLWKTVPILEVLQTCWEKMLPVDKFAPYRIAIQAGLDSLHKYYKLVDESPATMICLIFNPNVKMEYYNQRWDSYYIKLVKDLVEAVFKEYYREPRAGQADAATTQKNEPSGPIARGFSSAWINKTIAMRWNQESRSSEKDPLLELNKYLSDNLEQTHDVVAWWGMNQHRYPTMARIALDYLPIQGSAVPCERKFSSAGLTGTDRRNRLNVVTFEALQILKDGYKSGRVISNPAEPVAVGGELDQEEMDFLMQFTPQVLAAP